MKCRVLNNENCEITNNYSASHEAVDVVGGGYTLDYVTAHSDGTVVFLQDGYNNAKGSTGNGSYGNCIKLEHGNGYQTLYAHMDKNLLVKNGEKVKKGQRLGYMSDSGNAHGAHLHFEVWKNDNRIDPTEYLEKDFKSITQTEVKKTIDEIAKDVIEGKYGNYPERKTRLEAEGYNYSEVQSRVNEMLAPSVNYLSNKTYTGVSIVDSLNQIGVDSSFEYRTKLANSNGIANYSGTAEQNTRMLEMLKYGTLKSI